MLKSHKNSKAEYCPSLVLELESGDSGGDVFVNAKVVLLNSRNKSIFSDSKTVSLTNKDLLNGIVIKLLFLILFSSTNIIVIILLLYCCSF